MMESQTTFAKYPIEKLKLEECEDSKDLLRKLKESYEIEVATRLFGKMEKDYQYNEE